MLKKLLLAAYFVAAGIVVARAEISEDLKFCAKLTSGKERLACYDAAARIEKRALAPRRVVAPITQHDPRHAIDGLASDSVASKVRGQFDGGYIGLLLGTEIPLRNSFVADFTTSKEPVVPVDSLKGVRLGAVAGYNVVSGPLLFGLEARGFYAFNQNYLSNPYFIWQQEARVERNALFDGSVRAGMIFSNWLFYARAGLGAEHIVTQQRSDVWGYNAWTNKWQPIVGSAIGAEYSWANYFLRGEAEFQYRLDNLFYTPAVNFAVGYRF